ncbi:hypothetical protein L195_g061744, partial [Trifolium pratense]
GEIDGRKQWRFRGGGRVSGRRRSMVDGVGRRWVDDVDVENLAGL